MKKRASTAVSAQMGVEPQLPPKTGCAATAVFLVGFMGAGKTSVGRALAERLNWAFEDLDDRIVHREPRTVPEIFRHSGESEFRRAEHAALRDVLEELHGGAVKIVALGGGAFVQKRNAELLKASGIPTVFLEAPAEELWQRCCKQADAAGTERPLLRTLDQFRELYDSRRAGYLQASLTIQTQNRALNEIASQIAETLGLKRIEIAAHEGEVE